MELDQIKRDLDEYLAISDRLCHDVEMLSSLERDALYETYPDTRWLLPQIQFLSPTIAPPEAPGALEALRSENQRLKDLLETIFESSPPAPSEAKEDLRQSGIEVIGAVPWGTHFCEFYNTSQDLVETLVPYFQAGLAANEYCMWVTSAPLQVEEAIAAMRAAVPNFDDYLARGQIEILDYSQWYLKTERFEADLVLKGWTEKLAAARASGFDGLRLTGNTFWLEQAHWDDFTRYEETINSTIGGQNMIALCTYSLEKCGVREILDVVSNHQFALIKTGGRWEIIESAEHEKIEHALRVSEERLRLALWATKLGVFEWNVSTDQVLWANQRMFDIFGCSLQVAPQVMVQMKQQSILPEDAAAFEEALSEGMLPGRLFHTICRVRRFDDGELRWVEFSGNYERNAQGSPTKLIGVLGDITEQKQAEEALRQSREWLRVTLNSIGDGVIATDAGGRVTFLNTMAAKLTGWTAEEVLGQPIQQVFPIVDEKTGQVIPDIVTRVLLEKRVILIDQPFMLIAKDGHRVTVEDSAAPIMDARANTTGVVLVFHDVSEKRQAQETLRESEERYRSLFTQMNEGFALHEIICDSSGKPVDYRFLDVNPAFEQFTGLSRQQVLGRTVMEVLPETEPYWIEIYGEVALSGKPRHFQNFSQNLDRYYDVLAFCPRTGQFAALFIDITDQKRLQEQAREAAAHIELQHRLIEQREQERLKIAQDLHDGPVQELSAAGFALQGLAADCQDPLIGEAIQGIRRSLAEQVTNLRAFSQELRPPLLAKFGLEKAISAHLETCEQKHPEIHCRFESQMAGDRLPEAIQLALYRIYQEGLNNVIKHARAGQVAIRLAGDSELVVLTIVDDGIGFEPPEDWLSLIQQGHLGLVGIRERAEAVGGMLKITSSTGQGTALVVSVSLPGK